MRTDLIKFERGTIGFKCLNKEKDGLSKFGVMLNDMNKEIFDDMTIICPCCGSPVKLDLIHINFKKSSMMISKWFSYLAMCSNVACSYQYNAFLKKEFWEEIQINKNKISHTMTFGLSPGTLSLPIDDTYVLQDLLILCKEAGYKKIMFGARNAFNQIKKIGTKNSSYKLDPKKYAKHCYDLSDGFSTNMMTVIGYKDKNKDCKYNNISALSYIFYNILKIGSRKDTKDAETKKQSMQHFYVSYLPKNVTEKSILKVINFKTRDRISLLQYSNSAISLYSNTFNDISCQIDSDRIIYVKNYDNCNLKNFGITKSIDDDYTSEKETPSLELTIKGEDHPKNYDIYCVERYFSNINRYEVPYVFLILAGLDVNLTKY